MTAIRPPIIGAAACARRRAPFTAAGSEVAGGTAVAGTAVALPRGRISQRPASQPAKRVVGRVRRISQLPIRRRLAPRGLAVVRPHDRLHVRQYEEETQLRIFSRAGRQRLDGFHARGRGAMNKMDFARLALAGIAALAQRQGDAFGLGVAGTELEDFLRARARPCRTGKPSSAGWKHVRAATPDGAGARAGIARRSHSRALAGCRRQRFLRGLPALRTALQPAALRPP